MKIRNTTIVALAVVAAAYMQPELVLAQGPVLDVDSTSGTGGFPVWSRTAQALATIAAIVVGGILAWRNAHLFRSREPHVTISHQISHRYVGSEYVHLAVTTTLHNSSRVNVEFRDGAFTLQQIAPVSNEDIERLYAQVFVDGEQEYLQWATLENTQRSWAEDEFVVEPGETETEIYEFIVSRDVDTVVITTYFYNSRVVGKIPAGTEPQDAPRRKGRLRRWREVRGPLGWGRTTIYDILGSDDGAATVDSLVGGRSASDAEQEKTGHH